MVYYSDIENKALHDLRQIDPSIPTEYEESLDKTQLFDLIDMLQEFSHPDEMNELVGASGSVHFFCDTMGELRMIHL
ncbi:MAG: hypothetical protein COT85_01205 [Chlamydiae bacterium CG10_big_fil_rev_8_21_14_0_10_42_34]|nr:MAG: hypothetical protein COT85_01205 [Chlamydiae bacterium CG10_big_fil_rev_8_21_14_0_10_42_34]